MTDGQTDSLTVFPLYGWDADCYLFLRAMLLWLEVAELNGLFYGGLVGGFAAILWTLLDPAVVRCADLAWDFVAKRDVEGFHV